MSCEQTWMSVMVVRNVLFMCVHVNGTLASWGKMSKLGCTKETGIVSEHHLWKISPFWQRRIPNLPLRHLSCRISTLLTSKGECPVLQVQLNCWVLAWCCGSCVLYHYFVEGCLVSSMDRSEQSRLDWTTDLIALLPFVPEMNQYLS